MAVMSTMQGAMIDPPANEIIDFDTFASIMTSAPLNDLHKYYDSDDDHDLEDNYDGESNYDDQEVDIDLDLDGDISINGDSENSSAPTQPTSRHLDPIVQSTIERTELVLEQLSVQAQSILDEQPLSTQIILSNQANEQVFKPYSIHGSQAQFSESVMKFLMGGATVRQPGRHGRDKGKDGKLRFAPVDPNTADQSSKDNEKKGKLKRKDAHGDIALDSGERLKIKIPKRDQSPTKTSDKDDSKDGDENANKRPANHFGQDFKDFSKTMTNTSFDEPQASANALSFRKLSGPHDIMIELDTADETTTKPANPPSNTTPFTPLAATFANVQLKTPTAGTNNSLILPPTLQTSPQPPRLCTPPAPLPTNYNLSISPKLNALLSKQDYNPISLDFIWPATLRSNSVPCMPTPGYLDHLNEILHLKNAQARFLLSYYVRKYDTPQHLGGMAGRLADPSKEPPHALFRLGIAQYVMSRTEGIVQHRENDALGLTPEARNVLGSVWEEHPSTQTFFDDELGAPTAEEAITEGDDGDADEDGNETAAARHRRLEAMRAKKEYYGVRDGLNPLEKVLLARACNVSVDTVEAYWEDMRDKTKAWNAMQLWCRARSAEKVRLAKIEGRW